jgi:hypothetical protein
MTLAANYCPHNRLIRGAGEQGESKAIIWLVFIIYLTLQRIFNAAQFSQRDSFFPMRLVGG